MDEVLAEVENLIQTGFKEVVLVGVNLGLYGEDLPCSQSLVQLLKRLEDYGEEARFRLSSLEPHLVTDDLLELMGSSSSICPHLHLPLQSGDEYILGRMGRRYTKHQYRKLVDKVKNLIPGVAITTDVMVGFPGEEEHHFHNTYHFLEEVGFSRIHVFRFSPRPGTGAFSMRPWAGVKTQKKRSEDLRCLGRTLSQRFTARFLGKELRVLVEEKRDKESGFLMGYTDNYIRIFLEGSEELKNRFLRVNLARIRSDGGAIGKVEVAGEET